MNLDYPLFLIDYVNYLTTVRSLAGSTVKEYSYDIVFFLKFFRKRRARQRYYKTEIKEIPIHDMEASELEKCDIHDLQAYLAYSEDGRTESSNRRARRTSSLKSLFNYLVNVDEVFEKNPTDKLITPKRKQRQPVYLTLNEAFKLIETAARQENRFFKFRDMAMLVTFLTTGMRLSELCSLNLSSIQEDHFRVIGKGNKERIIYITESCLEAINNYLKVRPRVNSDALFLSSGKKRISQRAVQHRIDRLLREAGFDTSRYSTHKLRHTAATLMYKEGVDIRTLQRILGHASVGTTQIYTHVEDDMARKAVKKNPLAGIDISEIEEKEEGRG